MKQLFVWCGLLVLGLMSTVTIASDFSFGWQRGGGDAIKALKDITVGGIKDGDQKDSIFDLIKGAVNWFLGILGLIALLLVLYGGFLMVVSAGKDDMYNKGRTILKQALLGLLIIGISRFVISLILWLAQQVLGAAKGSTAGTDQ